MHSCSAQSQCKELTVGLSLAPSDPAALLVGLKHLLWAAAVSSAASADRLQG